MTGKKYSFEQIEKKNLRTFDPKVSLNSNSTFRFNAAMCRDYELLELPYAALYFDRESMAIAFQFLPSKCPDAFTVSHKSNRGSVAAIAFFRQEKLDSRDYKGQYTPELYDDPDLGKMFVICLKRAENN
ncbi:MAG: hypothetical protein DRP56_07780 [Planctomycetota bacterium]|nr:MAG: hypothetical protein DRP56_07780 [Planctomycetota bacterium]